MQNRFNFVKRFAPLSPLRDTIVEIDSDRFLVAPENLLSANVQDDHVVVWFKDYGKDSPCFAQMSDFVSYKQVMALLLPINLPRGSACPSDLLAVLECAPEEVLVAFATWAKEFDPYQYPPVREVWRWLNATWGENRP